MICHRCASGRLDHEGMLWPRSPWRRNHSSSPSVALRTRSVLSEELLSNYELLIVDELGYVPLSKSGAELLFETFSQRYERASTLVTSNLPFEEWTEVFGSKRLTGALLDRITHHVHILEMNGDSYRLKQSRRKRNPPADR